MKIISAKELKKEDLGHIIDGHGRKHRVHAADIDVHAVLDDGTEKKAVQRVLTASINTPELTMTVEVGQTQEDWQAQLRGILNAHAPGERYIPPPDPSDKK